jgi:exosortase C (VPDSG-CTERM-specific)
MNKQSEKRDDQCDSVGQKEQNGRRIGLDSERSPESFATRTHQRRPVRFIFGLGALAGLLLVFLRPLTSLAVCAAGSEIHSHILLVPFISAYLIYIRRKQMPADYGTSPGFASVALLVGLAALFVGWGGVSVRLHLSQNDTLSVLALSFFCFVVAFGFFFLGRKWMAASAFPVAFLIFLVPLPDGVVDWLETASKLASAEAAYLFFRLSGTPVLRDGTIFQLPGMVVEVAQECSGIRSSLVLFITGLLASNLLLKSPWRRAVLVAAVIPLGIVRNGIRILVVSLLCVHVGPHMIHSDIHRRGGPVFFAFSLIPLFILLWWLRRGESTHGTVKKPERVAQSVGEGKDCNVFHA